MPSRTTIYAFALMLLPLGCEKTQEPSATTAPETAPVDSTSPAPASSLTLVTDRSLVCMVNNQFMGQPQIPIEVSGKTYYGCCEMCKGRLANDPKSRSGVDPVSKRPVDKSVAVIAKTKTGATLYFENEQNFTAYAQGSVPN